MQVKCPNCEQALSLAQAISNGETLVRCGQCMHAFEIEISEDSESIATNGDLLTTARLTEFVSGNNEKTSASPVDSQTREYADAGSRVEPVLPLGEESIAFVTQAAQQGDLQETQNFSRGLNTGSTADMLRYGLGIPAALLLLYVLGIQLQSLPANLQHPPFSRWLCEQLNCRAASEFRVDYVQAERHPKIADALLIEAVLQNTGTENLAAPTLLLEFSDANQKRIASRQFAPVDYLEPAELEAQPGTIKAGDQFGLLLEIVDPGERATNYQLQVEDSN